MSPASRVSVPWTVLLVGGLAILSGGWLALWLWARGERPLSWGR
mgnify:CR=1 FL=1